MSYIWPCKFKDPTSFFFYLKKWAPTIRSWDLVFSPIKSRSIVEVLLASMQCGGQNFSRSENICCFKDTFSMTAYLQDGEQKKWQSPMRAESAWTDTKLKNILSYLNNHIYISKAFIIESTFEQRKSFLKFLRAHLPFLYTALQIC